MCTVIAMEPTETAPFSCLVCDVGVVEVTAVVDPQTIGLAHYAQCGHPLLPEVAESLWEHHGYRWTIPKVDGASLIAAERARQVRVEGFTPAHDAQHTDLAWAALAYISRAVEEASGREDPPVAWPWPADQWKPDKEPRRMLIVAGALVAAEMDRQLTEERTKEETTHE